MRNVSNDAVIHVRNWERREWTLTSEFREQFDAAAASQLHFLFGRAPDDCFLYIACSAGPADPTLRTDVAMTA